MALKGVDVHPSFQAGFPFLKSKIDFAICKITEGTGVMPGAAAFVEKARSNGLLTGVYHFLNGSDPVAQADTFVNALGKNWLKAGILYAVDWEQYGVSNGSVLWSYVNRVYNKTGVWPVVYTNSYDAAKISGADGNKVRANCGLWYAYWRQSRCTNWDTQGVGGLSGWTMPLWQCGVLSAAASANLLGYSGSDVDIDWFYGDKSTWEAYAGGASSGELTTVPDNPSTDTVAPGPSADETFYVVKSGDTLSQIAAMYGTTYQELATINGIANPNIIEVGQKIKINGAAQTQPAGGVTYYTVKSGDTLSAIASKYGKTWQYLAQVNGLSNPNLIHSGQVLVVS